MLKNVDLDSFAMHLAYFYSIFNKENFEKQKKTVQMRIMLTNQSLSSTFQINSNYFYEFYSQVLK
jgi:hypothetical protein